MKRSYILITACFIGALLLTLLLKSALGDPSARKDKKLRAYSSHYETAKKLATSGNPNDIALLINYVRNPPDGNPNTSKIANILELLENNTTPEVLDLLLSQKDSPDNRVCKQVALGLGSHPEEQSIDTLFQMFAHVDPGVRAAAVHSLIKLRPQIGVPYLDGIPLLVGREFDDRFLMQKLSQDTGLPVTFRHWAEWWFLPNKDTSAGAYWNHGVEERGKEAFIDLLQKRADESAKLLLCLSLQDEMRYMLKPKIIRKLLDQPNPYIDAFLKDLFAEGSEKRYEHTLDLHAARRVAAPYLIKASLIGYDELDRKSTFIHKPTLQALEGRTEPELLELIYNSLKKKTQDNPQPNESILQAIEFLGEAGYQPVVPLLMELSEKLDFRETCHIALAKIGTNAAIEFLLEKLNTAYDDSFSSPKEDLMHALLENRNHPWIEQYGADLAVVVAYQPGTESFLADYACLRLAKDLRFPVLRKLIAKRLTPIQSVMAPELIEAISKWDEPEAKAALHATGRMVTCPACRAKALAALGEPLPESSTTETELPAHKMSHTSYVWKEKFIGAKPISDPEEAIQALDKGGYFQRQPALQALYLHPEIEVDLAMLYALLTKTDAEMQYDLCAFLLTRQNDDPRPLPLWPGSTVVDWIKREPSRYPPECLEARLSAAFASNDYPITYYALDDFYQLLRDGDHLDIILNVFQSFLAYDDSLYGNQHGYLNQFFEHILPTCADQLQPHHLAKLEALASTSDSRRAEMIEKVTLPKTCSIEDRLYKSREMLNQTLLDGKKDFSDSITQPLWGEKILANLNSKPKVILRELDKLWGYRNPLLLPAGPGVQVRLWQGRDPHDALDMLHFLKGKSEETTDFDYSCVEKIRNGQNLIATLRDVRDTAMTPAQYAEIVRFLQSGSIPMPTSGLSQSVSLKEANSFYNVGDFEAAETAYAKIAAQEPSSLNALNNLALVWFHTGRQASALILWSWICENSAEPHLGALTNRYAAEVYFDLQEEAAVTAKQLVEVAPDSVQASYAMALWYFESKQFAEAKQWAHKCQSQAPLFYRAHYLELLIDTQTGDRFIDPILEAAGF